MSSSDVLEAVKASVKVNLAYIDKVVVVCSGRIEKPHSDSIKQFMKWLSFTKYKSKFVFIYNKADLLTEAEKVKNLLNMCEMLEADTNESIVVNINNQNILLKQNLTLGFPPNTSYKEVKYDLSKLSTAVENEIPNYPRIPLARSSCCIL